MYRRIKPCIDPEYQIAEVKQTGMLGDSGTGQEKNSTTRMCKQ
jgi:hypothetical protein